MECSPETINLPLCEIYNVIPSQQVNFPDILDPCYDVPNNPLPSPELECILDNPTPSLSHYPVEIEEIEDIDAPKRAHEDWSGEETFWAYEDNVEGDEGWEMDNEDHASIHVEDETEEETTFNSWPGIYIFPPTQEDAAAAFADITNILKPPRKRGHGYRSPGLGDVTTQTCLEGMRMFLGAYICLETDNPGHCGNWTAASNMTTTMHCESKSHARNLHVWT